jgi:hypothetical protein
MSDITPFPDKKKSFLFTKHFFLKSTNRKKSRKALTKEKNIKTIKDNNDKMSKRKKI